VIIGERDASGKSPGGRTLTEGSEADHSSPVNETERGRDAAPIICQGLTKQYGRVQALNGVELRMPAGSIFGFLGPNGSGKTTTIKILLGLALPTAGHCSIFGVPVTQFSAASRMEVGYLAQDPAYPRWMTGSEVLEFVGRLYPEARRPVGDRVREALRLVDLEKAAHRSCGGYSAGMRQRLGIAQALMGEPRLVILDEPSSSLDPIGRRDVLDILRSLRERGIAVFYSTHILDDVERVADHVAIMKEGRVVRQGAMADMTAGSVDTFRIAVEAPAEGLDALLRSLDWVTDVRMADKVTEGRVARIVSVRDGERAKRALPRALIDAELVLYACEPARQRLEDVFMETVSDVT
jgi:ABC-2 type transport system ATP-binding protein